MDEPKRSAAVASRYLIPIGLAVLAVAYVWPVREVQGPITTTYSRLLGFRVEDQSLHVRQIAGSIILNLGWLAVAVAALPRLASAWRGVAFGAAALLGVSEILYLTARLVYSQFVGLPVLLSGLGGALLVAGVIVGMGHTGAPEIRETEGGRA
ncbi:MAG TPA: hypothetical protein VEU29_08790 [Actinomycetota bacterium]|nr:hypothetical protein [Actinomycetota bacterium]